MILPVPGSRWWRYQNPWDVIPTAGHEPLHQPDMRHIQSYAGGIVLLMHDHLFLLEKYYADHEI